ncbi:hypothetical protein SAMN05518863_105156 [Candidatus Pantoea symbiotica]|uniref:DUF1640 domain-containing protein n=2 Tax=Pantoea TaxID=53335 RepID=A0A1I3XKS3_9GAMM|nr:hypothetical protein [Enterobacteriaceae bacterium RIT697]SFK20217.1 hypothetical protein SAMN05518863_105156 [Pantoea symbiotica]SFU80471.1 hypothetical protein SAMN05518864_105156 [Pantoea sp. YR525]
MRMTMINTHKAYLALQQAGVADKQAEVMVEIFAEMQQENSLTKIDLSQAMEGVVRMQHATNNRLDNLEQRFDHFEKDVTGQFQTIYKHFEKIDERFEKIDERFEKLDIRLGAMDQRMDQNFTALKKDSQWLKGILMAIVCTMIPATAKYMFMN